MSASFNDAARKLTVEDIEPTSINGSELSQFECLETFFWIDIMKIVNRIFSVLFFFFLLK